MMRSILRTVALTAMMGVATSAVAGTIDGGPHAKRTAAPQIRFAQADTSPAQAPEGDAAKGEMSKGDTSKDETSKSEPSKSEPSKSEPSKSEASSEGAKEEVAKSCSAPHAFAKGPVAPDLLRSSAAFSIDVLARLSPKAQNATVSPFGLASVLSTLHLGADDAMRKAITATLRFNKIDDLRREARLLEVASQRDSGRFASFNALFVDHRLPLKPGIADLARADVNVDVRKVDFGSAADIDGINKLLARKTNDRIKSILEPGTDATLVAANAFVFKDCWKAPFDKSDTANKPFTRPDGSKADRATMSVTSDAILHRASGRFVAVELPYLDEDFALTLVTTNDKPAKVADFKEAAPLLAGIDLAEANVSLSLPKFGGATDNELLDPLSEMGLKPGLASADQLPGFSKGLKLGRVRQKTWLAVDETGTEAAAVTTAEVTRSAQEPKAVTATFDKPFVFALRHRPTGAILMAGYVGDPGEEQAAKKD
jgi:serine protease inhibitor